jgi:hypothetical protein
MADRHEGAAGGRDVIAAGLKSDTRRAVTRLRSAPQGIDNLRAALPGAIMRACRSD